VFDGYDGFEPYPYREYSQPFFRAGYRVLRGGSWATRPRVATPTFRNWDHPERRQIFSGLRIVRDG
jgi:iron(II)-dependent oxidoreductase